MITIIYLVACLAVSFVGTYRKIGGAWTFIISLLTSPVIGLIVALLSEKKEEETVIQIVEGPINTTSNTVLMDIDARIDEEIDMENSADINIDLDDSDIENFSIDESEDVYEETVSEGIIEEEVYANEDLSVTEEEIREEVSSIGYESHDFDSCDYGCDGEE